MPETLAPSGLPPIRPVRPGMPAPGATAPATVTPRNDGQRMRGYIGASIAIKYLESLVPMFGSASDEGQAIMKALMGLSKHFGASASPDLSRQEAKLITDQATPAQPPSPQNMQAFQSMIRNQNLARGIGAASPAAAPPVTGATAV